MEVVYIVMTEEPDAELLAAFPTKAEAEVWAQSKPDSMEDVFVVPVRWKSPFLNPLQARDLGRVMAK
jgi:hypothetical protein